MTQLNNFTPRSGRNYSSRVQQNFNYRRMQQQRTGGNRQNLNQRLDGIDYVFKTYENAFMLQRFDFILQL